MVVGLGVAMCAATASAQRPISFSTTTVGGIFVGVTNPQALAAADLNNDARDDLILVDNFSDRFMVYLSNGTGAYPHPPTPFGTGAGPVAVTTGDVNADGYLDAITVNNLASTVTVWLGDGTGNFNTPRDFAVASGPTAIVAADLNNDRMADLAILSDDTVTPQCLLNGRACTRSQDCCSGVCWTVTWTCQ